MAEAKLDTQTRREQIAEAALSLVADHGLRRLSVAAVARRVGLVPSGIYRHFKSKDEILAAVLDRLEQRLLANVQAARQENADPLDCLKDVLTRHIRFIREGRAIPRIIFSDGVPPGTRLADNESCRSSPATRTKSARSSGSGNRKAASARTSIRRRSP